MRKKRIWISWALAISMLTSLASCGESGKTGESSESGESVRVNAIDNQYAATVNSLTATDALGRSFNEALVSDSNNKVGLFYWIWHGEHTSAGIFNISELLENDPDILWETGVACKEKSPINATHYWAEPLYGYYSSDDPWVIKKHLELLKTYYRSEKTLVAYFKKHLMWYVKSMTNATQTKIKILEFTTLKEVEELIDSL